MKKSLLALAALAATSGAFAQSSLTINGLVDVGVQKVSNDDATKDSTSLKNNGTGTSAVFFKGVEDLGGGLKAAFLLELDLNPVSSSTTNQGTGSSSAFTGTPFNGEQFVSLSGGFGEVKLGTPNAAALSANGQSQPFGTALGSGYSGSFGRLGSQAVSALNQYVGNGTGRIIRAEKTVAYVTPNFSGVTGQLEYSFGNDNATGASASNNNKYMSLALRYSAGPLNAWLVSAKASSGDNAAAGATKPSDTVVGTSVLGTDSAIKWTLLTANYNFGPAIAYFGYTTTKHDVEATEKSSSWNLAVKVPVTAQVDLMANYLKRDDKRDVASTAQKDAKLMGVGADYKLSPRSTLYFRYEAFDTDTSSATAGTAGSNKTTAFGVKHTF